MGIDSFRWAAELQEAARGPWMHIVHALQTSGTLLHDPWCRFFRRHDFLVGLSLGGPCRLHDAYRVDNRGRGSFRSRYGGAGAVEAASLYGTNLPLTLGA